MHFRRAPARFAPDFVVQFGDPQTRDMTKKARWGIGGSDRPIGVAEISRKGETICGLGGSDVIEGLGGGDTLLGGAGADRLTGGTGRDVLKGEAGNDRLDSKDGRADAVDGGPGRDSGLVDVGLDRVVRLERYNRH